MTARLIFVHAIAIVTGILTTISSSFCKEIQPVGDPSSYSIEVPMQYSGGIALIPVLINGALTLDFIIDSGAADVSVPADVVLTLLRTGTIKADDFIGTQTYVLADGSKVPSERFRIRSLKVGRAEIRDVVGSVARVQGSLLLGQSFLNRFKSWAIDNDRRVLRLVLKADTPTKADSKNSIGIQKENEHADRISEQPIQTQSGWAVLKTAQEKGPFEVFRKYSYTNNEFPNTIIFNCSKQERQPFSHLTFIIPKETVLMSFPRETWRPKINLRIFIDNSNSFNIEGEYNNEEIFIDKTSRAIEQFRSILTADDLAIGFGEQNDIVRFHMTEKVDNFISAEETIKVLPKLGDLRRLSRTQMFSECKKHQEAK